MSPQLSKKPVGGGRLGDEYELRQIDVSKLFGNESLSLPIEPLKDTNVFARIFARRNQRRAAAAKRKDNLYGRYRNELGRDAANISSSNHTDNQNRGLGAAEGLNQTKRRMSLGNKLCGPNSQGLLTTTATKQTNSFYSHENIFISSSPSAVSSPPPTRRSYFNLHSSCQTGWRGRLKKLVGEDWLFLALLGVLMAFCSFIMDFCIEKIQSIHVWLWKEVSAGKVGFQFLCWVAYTLVLVLFSTGFVHAIAPQAIGSGIPEMKTILRGVVLKEYLSFRTLIAKMVGLTVSLGSGLPVGKEGPFVHVASIVATLLSKLVTSFKGIFENESRNSEMLAAAAAVGVACTFGAPVGGVLFSIEVTSVYFAVRNYWRGFFAAACSATVFRLLAVVFEKEVTVVAFYRTSFPAELPFYPEEMIPFTVVGALCGFGGALFVFTHRSIVLFIRNNRIVKVLLQKHRFIYPALVALVISSLTFPNGYGQFIAGELSFREALHHLFTNYSWNAEDLNVEQMELFFMSAFANTLPLPAGIFVPVFVVGASFGRLVGESMAVWFPEGIRGATGVRISPGGYAVVGAAAFTGSVTHTVSVSVIVFELTGQIVYILPVMIAVLISNAIAAYLQPSIYDSMIQIKHLPYLPDILPTSSALQLFEISVCVHQLHVEDIMVRDVKCLSTETKYKELQDILITMPRLRAFPLVDKPNSMVLLGSIPRAQLEHALESHVGEDARRDEAGRREMARQVSENLLKEQEPQTSNGRVMSGEEISSGTDDPSRKLFSHSNNSVAPETHRGRSDSKSRFTVTKVHAAEEGRSSFGSAIDGDLEQQQHSPPRDRRFLNIPTLTSFSVPDDRVVPSRKRHRSRDSPNDETYGSRKDTVYNTIGAYMKSLARKFSTRYAHDYDPGSEEDPDLDEEDRKTWEESRLEDILDLDSVVVDPAPFQLVERTSLYKVHSLFSLLGLNRAYVTALGRLVGVVALRELRISLEKAQRGALALSDGDVGPERPSTSSVTNRHHFGGGQGAEESSSSSSGLGNNFIHSLSRDSAGGGGGTASSSRRQRKSSEEGNSSLSYRHHRQRTDSSDSSVSSQISLSQNNYKRTTIDPRHPSSSSMGAIPPQDGGNISSRPSNVSLTGEGGGSAPLDDTSYSTASVSTPPSIVLRKPTGASGTAGPIDLGGFGFDQQQPSPPPAIIHQQKPQDGGLNREAGTSAKTDDNADLTLTEDESIPTQKEENVDETNLNL